MIYIFIILSSKVLKTDEILLLVNIYFYLKLPPIEDIGETEKNEIMYLE